MNKEKRVTVLFDEEGYNELVAEAKKVGLSRSGYVRLMYGYAREYIKSVTPMGAKIEQTQGSGSGEVDS